MSVIIAAYDRPDEISRVLAAYQAQRVPPLEVLVIDNSSSPAVGERVKSEHPWARLIRLPENRGFAASMNIGASLARGELLLFSPDDVIPAEDYVGELTAALDAGAAAVGGLVREWPDASRINTGPATISRILRLHVERAREPASAVPIQVPIIVGSMAMSRARFTAAGGFEESYGSFFEDADLSLRVRADGGRLVFAPRAVAHHITHGATPSPAREYLTRRNLILFYFRHAPGLPTLVAFIAYLLGVAAPRDAFRALARRDRIGWRGMRQALRWAAANPRLLLRQRNALRDVRARMRRA